MEINANISNAVASSISKLNLNTARRPFEAQKPKIEEIPEEKTEITPESAPKKNAD